MCIKAEAFALHSYHLKSKLKTLYLHTLFFKVKVKAVLSFRMCGATSIPQYTLMAQCINSFPGFSVKSCKGLAGHLLAWLISSQESKVIF